MFQTARYLLVLLLCTAAFSAPRERTPPAREELKQQMAERAADRFQHREARIREAIERGDLTPGEADLLRQRLEMRRQRLERWRELQEKLGERVAPGDAPLPANAPTATPPAN